MIKFTKNNKFYAQTTYEFNLPAGYTCPYGKECKICVNEKTGKFNKMGDRFRCYAASGERYPSVRKRRWENYRSILNGELIELPKDAKYVRIHASGDFFSQEYFDKWLVVCRENPQITFWAFTKSLPFWLNRIKEIPENLHLQASYGGYKDYLIKENRLKYAKVFMTTKEAKASGLPIDTDDKYAMSGKQSFALVDRYEKRKKKKDG